MNQQKPAQPTPSAATGQQFTLRQMFRLMTAIAIWSALVAWFGPCGFAIGCIMATAIAAYYRWANATEVVIVCFIVVVLASLFLDAYPPLAR